MQARFLHLADCHLGKWQYNHKERYNDFGRAFHHIIDVAIAEHVDFVILAGDLFEKRAIDALTLNQAMRGLERLHRVGIPCIAVEGNHERAYYGEQVGWLEFLAVRDLLILLNAPFTEGVAQLSAYTSRRGSYIDPVPGLRVHGLRYLGAGTATAVEQYATALAALANDDIAYTIFVAHAGVEGVVPDQTGGLSHRQWAVLQPHVNYLALGHVHKPFSFDHWIYNPGSPETCNVTEALWHERGYYLVSVDTARDGDAEGVKHCATLHANPRRPFQRLTVKTDLLGSPAELHDHCREFLQRRARDLGSGQIAATQRPVVELQLSGVLPFARSAVDLAALETLVRESFDPLVALVKNYTRTAEMAVEGGELLSRTELERQVITDLLERDVRYRAQSEAWASMTLSLKQLALSGSSPETVVTELANQLTEIEKVAPPQETL
ncbi:MAG: DNA repair exonuclease [Caldilineaceae bacterium]